VDRALRLQAVSAALVGALTPSQVAEVILTQGVAALDAYASSLVVLTADETELELIGATGYPSFVNQRFQRVPLAANLPIYASIRTREPIFIEDVATTAETFPDLIAISARTGSRALVALPLQVEDRVFGALGLSFQQPRVFHAEEQTFILTLAGQCALALERARLYTAEFEARQRAEAAQQRLSLLAQASQVLASSLDYTTILSHVARLALPDLADWSALTLVMPDQRLDVIALAHIDPAKEELLREYQRLYPSDPNIRSGVHHVVRTGESQFIPHITAAALEAAQLTPNQIDRLQALGLVSYMCVPLRATDQTLGTLSFVSASPERQYTAEDRALAEELAHRAAIAIQNARLYHEAQDAIRLRDEFLTMASHELRTPLTSLLGMSHMLQKRIGRETAADERMQRGIGMIAKQAERLKALIDRMFDLSRVHLGYLELELQLLDVHELARRTIEEARPLLQRHTIQLICREQSIWLEADEARLEQVLQNILHNAIKYTPNGGPIQVAITSDEQAVQIAITDCGIGIPEAAREHVFKRFYRASNGIHRNISGLGLGLYLANEIVKRHDGSIAFHSTDDQGTTFTITLPQRLPPQPVPII
jgi:K+-sensing histidine kinase KdpD